MEEKPQNELEKAASEETRLPFFKDFFVFLMTSKKWWLLPILVILLVMSLVLLVSSSALSPFLYSFF